MTEDKTIYPVPCAVLLPRAIGWDKHGTRVVYEYPEPEHASKHPGIPVWGELRATTFGDHACGYEDYKDLAFGFGDLTQVANTDLLIGNIPSCPALECFSWVNFTPDLFKPSFYVVEESQGIVWIRLEEIIEILEPRGQDIEFTF